MLVWTSAEITVEGPPRILGVTRTEPVEPSTVMSSPFSVVWAEFVSVSAS